MGLDLLTERLQEIRRTGRDRASVPLQIADVICLDEFLKLLARNLSALAQFKSMLVGLIGTASEAVSALNLIIAQLETANNIAKTFLQTFRSAKTAAISSLIPFPFSDDNYLHCRLVQEIKDFVTKTIPRPDPASLLPGNAQRYAKKYKQSSSAFKELEYRIFRNERKIEKLRKRIREIEAQILVWQATVDAIGEQFGV